MSKLSFLGCNWVMYPFFIIFVCLTVLILVRHEDFLQKNDKALNQVLQEFTQIRNLIQMASFDRWTSSMMKEYDYQLMSYINQETTNTPDIDKIRKTIPIIPHKITE